MHRTFTFTRALAVCAVATISAMGTTARAADYYAGKTIDFVIGGNPGGGYDTYARTVGRYLPKYLPGHPAIIHKNMPGAGSSKAALYIYSVAPKNGRVIGAIYPGAIMGPMLDPKLKGKYDPTKLVYLASADSGTRVCLTSAKSKIKTLEDATRHKTILGASAAGGSTKDYAVFLNATAGTKFDIVTGYKGSVDILLAVERGEVDGLCGLDWSSLLSQRPNWAKKGAINLLVQMSVDPDPGLTKRGVPSFWKYMKTEEDRQMGVLLVSQQIFGRPYIAPPGTPAEAVKLLRDAMAGTMKDPQYLADAKRERLTVSPSAGEKVQDLVAKLYATSPAIIEKAKAVMLPPKGSKKKKKK